MDSNKCVLLVLLDLSAAFDTIDHGILIQCLEQRVGVTAEALTWFKSYLSDREQCVFIEGVHSESCKLRQGVPQGSVLGPILFTLYMLPLGDIIRHHGLCYHFYADDSQLYITFEPLQDAATVAVTDMIQIKA